MARYAAKNVVAAGLADRCELQLAYSIGVAEPVSLMVSTFGTGKVEDHKISNALRRILSFKPASMIETLKLKRPIYEKTASYGHFGRDDADFTWEKLDLAAPLREAAGLSGAPPVLTSLF
jgi:S-adenosylmethionine synthetase